MAPVSTVCRCVMHPAVDQTQHCVRVAKLFTVAGLEVVQ